MNSESSNIFVLVNYRHTFKCSLALTNEFVRNVIILWTKISRMGLYLKTKPAALSKLVSFYMGSKSYLSQTEIWFFPSLPAILDLNLPFRGGEKFLLTFHTIQLYFSPFLSFTHALYFICSWCIYCQSIPALPVLESPCQLSNQHNCSSWSWYLSNKFKLNMISA